jgi:hypothetical protein
VTGNKNRHVFEHLQLCWTEFDHADPYCSGLEEVVRELDVRFFEQRGSLCAHSYNNHGCEKRVALDIFDPLIDIVLD